MVQKICILVRGKMRKPEEILSQMKIVQIEASRTVRTPMGETSVEYTASWSAYSDDPLMGVSDPLTVPEARIAQLLLSKETDIAAYRSAISNGSVPPIEGNTIIRTIDRRYTELIKNLQKENNQ